MPSPTVYLNNTYLPLNEAKVSVMDRGYLFGDGVYEVIPVYGGHPFRFTEHLLRLQSSLDLVRIPNPKSMDEWREIFARLIDENEGEDQSVYLQVTRGVLPQRDHTFPDDVVPSVFVMCNPLPTPPEAIRRDGIAAITLDDVRWKLCNIKAITLLPNVLMRREASDAGAAEAILVRDGHATEGAASNLFIVMNGVIRTPPTGPELLPGITRDLLLELARDNQLDAEEAEISEADLLAANEIWMTSSTKEVVAVTSLNGEAVGNGKPGPMCAQMLALYQTFKAQLRNAK